jgi:hypothetical protein
VESTTDVTRYGTLNAETSATYIRADRLYPYAPWSSAHPSTSPEIDDDRKRTQSQRKIGTWCPPNAFLIVALSAPYPFGVGKVLRADIDGVIHYQWYEPPEIGNVAGPYLPCWWDESAALSERPTPTTTARTVLRCPRWHCARSTYVIDAQV